MLAADVMKWTGKLRRTAAGWYVADQLMRSAASAGANCHEARGAESPADFVHKLQLALKELRESPYWIGLAEKGAITPKGATANVLDEADQLVRIVAKSVVTAKSNRKRS
ncbi:MAG: four helix bundle protein [Planctomycetes bacterium]|nr:four helix bundle protein [Planctomycetota bacterium]